MKSIRLFTVLALTVLLTACTHMKVSSERDPAYRFGGIRTYQWTDPPPELMEIDGACLDLEMQQLLNNELAGLGWTQVLDTEAASVKVAYCIHIRSHSEYSETSLADESSFSGGLVFTRNEHEWNYEQRGPDRIEYVVETGRFHLLIHDASSGKRVWHGTVEAEIDRSRPPEAQVERFEQIARKLSRELSRNLD